MESFVHDAPASRVVFGPGSLATVPREVERLGAHRVLVVAADDTGAATDTVLSALGERVADRWSEVVMHVPVDVADRAAVAAATCDADLLLCLGGGSATGMAKAVALRTGLPILAVPTTYAGSEMTPIWGQTAGSRKTTGRDSRVVPRVVVYDPDLTLTLPAPLAAASGMNAMAHAFEGLYAPDASPVTILMAEESIRSLAGALPRVVAAPDERPARGAALYGAWLAGAVLGAVGMGVHHKVCHVLGGTWNLPHADVHAAILPYTAQFNAHWALDAMTRTERALGAAPGDGAGALWDLAAAVHAPTSLAAVGFPAADVAEAAALVAGGNPRNPRPVDAEGVAELLRNALSGQRPVPIAGPGWTDERRRGPAANRDESQDASGGPAGAGGAT
jgi:alcohol dehydrogenase class IV